MNEKKRYNIKIMLIILLIFVGLTIFFTIRESTINFAPLSLIGVMFISICIIFELLNPFNYDEYD